MESTRVEMVTHVCVSCGVAFSMPKSLNDWRQVSGKKIFCPNGHKQRYVSEKKRLRRKTIQAKKLAEDNARLQQQLTQLMQEREHQEAAIESLKAKATKSKAVAS